MWEKCNGKMYGDGVSQRRRYPRSEAGLTGNLSNRASIGQGTTHADAAGKIGERGDKRER